MKKKAPAGIVNKVTVLGKETVYPSEVIDCMARKKFDGWSKERKASIVPAPLENI
ncbi:MAG: hypothetical protein FWD93_00080 [Coriobacteriia bacterium]|nr:hypothetical protein [Coriobacteriia bacterium]MCL2605664.1 hypothetical protein [Coriobacteriia bacterium]